MVQLGYEGVGGSRGDGDVKAGGSLGVMSEPPDVSIFLYVNNNAAI